MKKEILWVMTLLIFGLILIFTINSFSNSTQSAVADESIQQPTAEKPKAIDKENKQWMTNNAIVLAICSFLFICIAKKTHELQKKGQCLLYAIVCFGLSLFFDYSIIIGFYILYYWVFPVFVAWAVLAVFKPKKS